MCPWIQTKGLSENDVLSIPVNYGGWLQNPAQVDRWQTSHYLQGFNHPFGDAGLSPLDWQFWNGTPSAIMTRCPVTQGNDPCSTGTKGFNMLNSLIKVSSTRAWNVAVCCVKKGLSGRKKWLNYAEFMGCLWKHMKTMGVSCVFCNKVGMFCCWKVTPGEEQNLPKQSSAQGSMKPWSMFKPFYSRWTHHILDTSTVLKSHQAV